MKMKAKKERAFTLIEVVTVIAILCILAGMLLPLSGKLVVAQKTLTVRSELEQIRQALDFYYYDNHGYPGELYELTSGYLPIVDTSPNSYENTPVLTDDFSLTQSRYGYGTGATSACTTENAWVWSVGPDGIDYIQEVQVACDGINLVTVSYYPGNDEIMAVSYSQIPGTQHTRLKLDLIGAALCKYYWDPAYATPNTMTAVADWSATSTTRAALLLLHEFNTDGFGVGFKNTAPPASGNAYDTPVIYSYGYDQTDDSGSDDDICF